MALNKIMPGRYDGVIYKFLESGDDIMVLDTSEIGTDLPDTKTIRTSISGRIVALGLKGQMVCSMRDGAIYLAKRYDCVNTFQPSVKARSVRHQPSIYDPMFQKFIESGKPLGIVKSTYSQDIHSLWTALKYAVKSHGYPIYVAEDYASGLIYLIRNDAKEDSGLYVDY